MRLAALLCLGIAAILASLDPRPFNLPEVEGLKQVDLSIDREESVGFTSEQAATILKQGLTVLSTIDISGHDVATNVPLHFNGRIETFSYQKGIIDTCTDLDKLFEMPHNVHVVKEIHCCGGVKGGSILGCSDANRSLVITFDPAFPSVFDGILWMHEYGHHQGLCHRNDRSAIMYPVIDLDHTTVNWCEHEHFLGLTSRPCVDQTPYSRIKARSKLSAVEFVHQIFIEGVPYDQARVFTKADVAPLLRLLHRRDQRPYWANTVTVLGSIGDISVFQPLKQFVDVIAEDSSPAARQARDSVPIALGYLWAETKDPAILTYLLSRLPPADQPSPSVEIYGEERAHSIRMTILGLALSGNKEVGDKLQMQLNQLNALDTARTGASQSIERFLKEAITINRLVRENGLSGYYHLSTTDQPDNCHD
jgi:matrixin